MIFQYDALDLYDRARQQGLWYRVGARLRGQSTDLLELGRITAGSIISTHHSTGTQSVPLGQIRGSEGRHTDFDDTFHPLGKHTRSRWLAVAVAWLEGVELPPIDLIRVGKIYFVRDGHHRISVVRALGLTEITAVVTVWDITALQKQETSQRDFRWHKPLAWR